MSNKMRLLLSKTGRAKYISHLDLMATMRRGLLRAGVPLKYSEGFNPHPYMSAALPLPVGVGSICELMDFGTVAGYLPPDDLPLKITDALPEGIEVFQVYTPRRKFAEIAWIAVKGSLVYDAPHPKAAEILAEVYAAESIVISKKTKRGVSEVDIAPLIRDIKLQGDGEIIISGKISAQNPSLSTENLISALSVGNAGLAPDYSTFERTELFDSDMNIFR